MDSAQTTAVLNVAPLDSAQFPDRSVVEVWDRATFDSLVGDRSVVEVWGESVVVEELNTLVVLRYRPA